MQQAARAYARVAQATQSPRELEANVLIKAASRKALNQILQLVRAHAFQNKWGATALVIDVDPLSLM